MLLTKLEIKGFKSFGDRVVINFDEGITGIVGPNGCGKSNVVDAIRWVLGEQKTRALRSEKMENIIFNGTKARRATNMAEVSLTFNNTKNLLPTEYSQVTITRRYYRSGESEYLLNGVTCRLKDITNLFLDTGIASNSYAIIELKMVDDILNDKENSRRGLFEEAAGVSKFKIRKKETLKKLEDTDADLERVEDLLFEIAKNLKTLEKQAKQTEKYYATKEEYKKLSIALAKKTVQVHTDAFLSLNKQIENESDKKINLNKEISEKEALSEQLKTDLINKEKLLSSRQRGLNDHVNKIRQYESDKKIKNERLRFLTDKSNNLKAQIEQDRQSNERAAFSIQSLGLEKASAEKLFAETEANLNILKEEYEAQKGKTSVLQEEVSTQNKAYREKQDQTYQINKSVEIKQIQLSTLKQELEKASSDTQSQTASLAEFEDKVLELKEKIDDKSERLSVIQLKETELQQRIETTGKFIEVIREELTNNSRKLDAKQNEFNLTKSLVDNLEGFPEAIKFLKKNSNWGKSAPLLSDVLTCDEKYRVAIENFLEPFMNYYIVETEEQALQAVNLLSDAVKGKANFFVLKNFDSFRSTPVTLFSSATPATDIVEYESKYKGLISYILDNVYISEGDIKELPESSDNIFITASGKIIKRKYSISGGSVGLFEGKRIGRAKNLEKLEAEIKELNKKIDGIKESLNEKQKELETLKLSTHKHEIDELSREINLINQEYVSVKTKHEQFSNMLSSNATKREDIFEKVQQLTDELSTLKPQADEEQFALKDIEHRINLLNSELVEQNDLLSRRSTAFNQENILFHQHQNKVASIEQEISFKESAYQTSKQRIEKNQEELKDNETEIQGLLERADVNDEELIQMYTEKDTIELGVNEAEKDYYQCRGDIDRVEKEAKEIQRTKGTLDELIMQLQNKLNETKLLLTSVKERLSVEFNLDLDKIMAGSDESEVNENHDALDSLSEEELKQKVVGTKEKLEKIGPINPMAMEAYQEIKERHDFIIAQKQDLTNAKESLMTTIGEIDTVAKETFLQAYKLIKDNFIKVFRSLFTDEDDCDLRLSDPENPLESTIDIIAKPKGKRPLTINQLSGGEKTLTATSLLFAIYLLKPAPFCIFDEVDAPLDDANIDKFNNIIKKFSDLSQFIIVTHNKRTMASTDVMYGVTMIEQGVSRVVPVDLRALAE